nr:MAG TPA: hypothetical protein [Caudoviricetes sp.]
MSTTALQLLFSPIKIAQLSPTTPHVVVSPSASSQLKNVPKPHPVNNVLSFKFAWYYIVTNCTYHRNSIPLVPNKDQNPLPRSLKFRSFFD